MKMIGLIGGITWQSTILYYSILNELALNHDSDIESAKCLIHSLEFGEIARLQREDNWERLNEIMEDAGASLAAGGAEVILICANTMHLCVEAVKRGGGVPVIHIAEVTAEAIIQKGLKKVALLGTKFTMEKDFFKDILRQRGIDVVIPSPIHRDQIHQIIYDELAVGTLTQASKTKHLEVIRDVIEMGAEGVILGCTEIPLLIQQSDVSVPIFNTTELHAQAAFDRAVARQHSGQLN